LVREGKLRNFHWILQYRKFKFNEIIKIENPEELQSLNEKYNLGLDLSYDCYRHVKKYKSDVFVGKSSLTNISRVQPQYSCFYDDEIKSLVYDIYKKDIETYGYTYDLE
jgi:hypothetical protein